MKYKHDATKPTIDEYWYRDFLEIVNPEFDEVEHDILPLSSHQLNEEY